MGKRGKAPIIPIKGEKFGEWTVTGEYEMRYKSNMLYVQAFCSCSPSVLKFVYFNHIKTGKSKSCSKCKDGPVKNNRANRKIPPKGTIFGNSITTGKYKWGHGRSRGLYLEVKCSCEAGTVGYKAYGGLKANRRPGCKACSTLVQCKKLSKYYKKDGTNVLILKETKPYRNNTIGYKGVSLSREGNFIAGIMFRRKKYWLGTFDTPEAAGAEYLVAKELLHGAYIKEFNEKYLPKVPIEINYEGCKGGKRCGTN